MRAKILKIGKYSLALFGNMDKKPVFFDVNWSHWCCKSPYKMYISRIQLLDVRINKPYKSIRRECWKDHVVKIVEDAGEDFFSKHFLFNFFIQYLLLFVPFY